MTPGKSSLPAMLLLLGGCCHFAPCHRGTYVVGTVTDGASGRPIPGAMVRLYRREVLSDATGCFSLGGPDALPFEFGISADGYKPLVVEAIPGSYQVTATLVPEHGIGESASHAKPIDRDRFARLSLHCPGARR